MLIWYVFDMVCFSPVGYLTGEKHTISTFVDQTHIQRTRPRSKAVFLKTSLPMYVYSNAYIRILIFISIVLDLL